MAIDWGAEGFDWRDTSLDEALAAEWLQNERLWRRGHGRGRRVPEGYNLDVDGWARQLVETDLDPERGWQLVFAMVRKAEDDEDLRVIGDGPLYLLIRNHTSFVPMVTQRAAEDPRLQKALQVVESWGTGGTDHRRQS